MATLAGEFRDSTIRKWGCRLALLFVRLGEGGGWGQQDVQQPAKAEHVRLGEGEPVAAGPPTLVREHHDWGYPSLSGSLSGGWLAPWKGGDSSALGAGP